MVLWLGLGFVLLRVVRVNRMMRWEIPMIMAEAAIALRELINSFRGRKNSDGSWNVESSIESDASMVVM